METASAARVLVIDDSADMREMLSVMIGASGDLLLVGQARDGREGVELVDRLQPDIVLLDLAMPVMDGLEALPLIRASSEAARIIVFSGFDGPGLKEQMLGLGANGFVSKGAGNRELMLMIAQVLQQADLGNRVPAKASPKSA